MRRSVLDYGGSEPRAFEHLLRLITGHFDRVDQAGGISENSEFPGAEQNSFYRLCPSF